MTYWVDPTGSIRHSRSEMPGRVYEIERCLKDEALAVQIVRAVRAPLRSGNFEIDDDGVLHSQLLGLRLPAPEGYTWSEWSGGSRPTSAGTFS